MLLTHLFGSSGQEPAPNGLFDGSPPVVEGSAFREIMQGFQFAEEEGGSQTTGPYPSLADLIAQVIAQDGETAASGPHRMPSDFPQQGITAPPADAEPVTSDAPLSEARIAPPAKTETPSVPLERTALPPGDTHVFLPSTETSEFASDRPPSSNDVNVILPDEGAILQHRSEVGVDPPPPDPSGRPTDESAERDGQLPVPDHLDTAMVDAQRPEERATPVPKGGENIVEVTPNESDPPQRQAVAPTIDQGRSSTQPPAGDPIIRPQAGTTRTESSEVPRSDQTIRPIADTIPLDGHRVPSESVAPQAETAGSTVSDGLVRQLATASAADLDGSDPQPVSASGSERAPSPNAEPVAHRPSIHPSGSQPDGDQGTVGSVSEGTTQVSTEYPVREVPSSPPQTPHVSEVQGSIHPQPRTPVPERDLNQRLQHAKEAAGQETARPVEWNPETSATPRPAIRTVQTETSSGQNTASHDQPQRDVTPSPSAAGAPVSNGTTSFVTQPDNEVEPASNAPRPALSVGLPTADQSTRENVQATPSRERQPVATNASPELMHEGSIIRSSDAAERFARQSSVPAQEVSAQVEEMPTRQVSAQEAKMPARQVSAQEAKMPARQVSAQEAKMPARQVSAQEVEMPARQVSAQEVEMPARQVKAPPPERTLSRSSWRKRFPVPLPRS